MLQKYERKAEDVLEKLAHEEPSERNFEMMANALVILAGGKVMGAMGGEMEHYDGMPRHDYRRGRTRVSGYTRRRYDGMDGIDGRHEMFDGERDGEEMEYRRGDGRRRRYDGGSY